MAKRRNYMVKRESEDTPFKRLRGVATVAMSTDEIIALTRNDMTRNDGEA